TGSDEKFQLDSSGRYTYTFIAGPPNTVYTTNDTLSFTKRFEAFLYPDNQYLYGNAWMPQPARAVVIGSSPKSGGFDFLTVGPNIIDFVVRRPPGSSSVAMIAKGKNYVSEETNVAIGSTDSKIGAVKRLGFKTTQTTPVAPGAPLTFIESLVSDDVDLLANVVSSGREGSVYVNNYSTNLAISTQPISGLPGHVANLGDVYVGKSENYRFSDVYSIEVVPSSLCTNPSVSCPLPPSADNTSLAIITTRGYSKEGMATSFYYSEYEIINNIIPLLERKRNDALADSTKYRSKILTTHELYGSNNDDLLWYAERTATNPTTTELADTTGPSYTLLNKPTNKSYIEWDEVRRLNQDIRLWKEAIANNEKIKYQVTNNRSKFREIDNFSFDSRTKITKTYTTESGEGSTREWEAAAGVDLSTNLTTTVNESGFGFKSSTTTLGGRAGTEQSITTLPMSWEFTLEDNDLYDRFTVDVFDPKDGGSPVFINRGGRSRCPYEGPQYSNFYDPAVDFISSHTKNANKTISDGTVQIEAPVIEVIGSSIRENVPASSAATFTIRLKNNSNHKLEYQLGVAEESNANGAIVKIDGLDPTRLYNMDSQMVVIKVVTIERGPESYVYDDIEVEFESPCEEKIKSSVKLSARFTPTCTDLGIKSPFNNWVVNTNSNNRLPVVIENYDINFSYFNNFQLEYKSKAATEWTILEKFSKDAPSTSPNYIPRASAVTTYNWDSLNEVKDGLFEIRAVSNCYLDSAGLNIVSVVSPSKEGIIDLTRPKVFGTPSPGDGILSPNDDISIQFTEDIDNTLLRFDNFEIKGIPNTAPVKHNATLFFDGVNDRAELQQSPNFAQKSFTMSFYAMPKRLNQKQVIISQGVENNKLEIGFDDQNRFYAIIGNSSVRATRPVVMSQKTLSPNYTDTTEIRCFTVSYNKESETILLYVDNERMNNDIDFVTNYTSAGKLSLGVGINQSDYFRGNLTDFRLFNKALTNSEIILNLNKRASISDAGILHNWSINEGSDSILIDKIRRRELTLIGPQWVLSNPGRALQMSAGGSNVLSVNSGTYPITNSMDMTLEFWFKTNANTEQVLMSTGNPQFITNTGFFEPYWQFKLLSSGLLQIGYEGTTSRDSFTVSSTPYNDGNWHHFAMVISRTTNLSSYIDGKLLNTKPAQGFPSFASSQLTLGGLKRAISVSQPTPWIEKRFVGHLDEFRVWELARTAEQIANEKNTRLTGKEMGLKCYLPFETYKDNANVLLIDSTFENQSDSGVFSFLTPNSAMASLNNISPVIKLAEPITNYPVTFLTNKDKIILIPEVSAAAI
ncbi:MAG: LamG domain-containing protein, partial [Bacteroidia bacterium]|nr:LamG domain-containing protein [Bacteroidia bacterium]